MITLIVTSYQLDRIIDELNNLVDAYHLVDANKLTFKVYLD